MDNQAPISVCMIVRNERLQLEKCLLSIRPFVKEICILDTGSSDETPQIAKKYADKFDFYSECNDENGNIISFSNARNKAFSMATMPWVMWLDGDDEVINGRKLNELVERSSNDSCYPIEISIPYEWRDKKENTILKYYRERIVKYGDKFEWKEPVHEWLSCKEEGCVKLVSEEIIVVHRKNLVGKRTDPERNIRILEKHFKEERIENISPRLIYYMGKEQFDLGRFDQAIATLNTYIQLSKWDDEKCTAMLKIAEAFMVLKKYDAAITWSVRAMTIKNWSSPFFSLAKSFYLRAMHETQSLADWERCAHFCKIGLGIDNNQELFYSSGEKIEIHRYYNFALNKMGKVKEALESVNFALSYKPDDESLISNKLIYEKHLLENDK